MKKALVVAVLALSSALSASVAAQAQQGRQPHVQAVQSRPTVGQQAWSSDGWLYQMGPSGWVRTQMSRTVKRGWVYERNHQTNVQTRYPTNNPNAKQIWTDLSSSGGPRGWLTEAQQVAYLKSLVGKAQRAVQAQQGQQRQRGYAYPVPGTGQQAAGPQATNPIIPPGSKLIAPNVRESIPMPGYGATTPEEQRYQANSNIATIRGGQASAAKAACEARRLHPSSPHIFDQAGNVRPDSGYHGSITAGIRPNAC